MAFKATYKTVNTEDCELHYWYRGSGPLLILIPGGGGHGARYNPLFPYLDKNFTVCTYDRRQNADSKVKEFKPLNMAQQARDVLAIIDAMDYKKASIFGNSGGAIIAFQLAVSYPEYLDLVIAHEAPTTTLLNDTTYHLDRSFSLLETYYKHGPWKAQDRFCEGLKGYDTPQGWTMSEIDLDNFWRYEFIYFTIYCPNLQGIVKNKVKIAVAAGQKSGDAFYARTTYAQAEILACKHYLFPGHHTAHEHEPEAFGPQLLQAFDELRAQRGFLD